MTNGLIDLKQVELHFEKANGGGEMAERGATMAVTGALIAGAELIAAKTIVPHGEWLVYLGKHWSYSQPKANRYMTIAANYSCVNNLKDAKSINEALRMIAAEKVESEPDTAPRSARKPADVVVTTPSEQPGQTDVQADPDPAPAPPTNRKTAKGSEKVPEDDKPRTQQVPVEIVEDEPESDPFEYMTFGDIIAVALSKLADDSQKKKAAKELRKAADKLDPPTKFVKPDLDEVSEYFRELQAVDPESFFDFYESKGWLVGKVSMKDWRASARKWVRENHANGKVNGNGHSGTRNGRSRGLTADEVFSAESMGRSR